MRVRPGHTNPHPRHAGCDPQDSYPGCVLQRIQQRAGETQRKAVQRIGQGSKSRAQGSYRAVAGCRCWGVDDSHATP